MKQILFIIIILAVSSLTGCMMMGGMMHKMHHHELQDTFEKLQKEVEIHNYRITAEYPPLFYNEKAVFRLKIYSFKDSLASTASVRLLISEIGNEHLADAVQFDSGLNKDSAGNYSESHIVKSKKDLKITYFISELEGVVLKKPIEIEAERNVHLKQSGMTMHDIGPFAIVGGVIMLTMMVFMIGRLL